MKLYEFFQSTFEGYAPETIDIVKTLYDRGFLVKQIASELDLKENQVTQILRAYHKDRIKRHGSKEINAVRTLYNQGLEDEEIASQLGIRLQLVKNIVATFQIDQRRF